MEVIILAGGLGTRLRSAIGDEIPKCMAPVGGRPFLGYLLYYLSHYPVSRIILSVGHLRNVIIDWIDKNEKQFPFSFDYAIETEPLGTGGGIKLALSKCTDENPVVINGDTFFDVNLDEFVKMHKLYPSNISLALKPMRDFSRYGRVIIDSFTHEVKQFCEKQPCKEGLINGGVYCIKRNSSNLWPDKQKFSFETEVLEPQAQAGKCYGFDFNDYFIDIGIPEDYAKAKNDFIIR